MEGKKLHILLCDDSDDDRYFFKQAIKKNSLPIELDTVNDGEELMAWLAKRKDSLPDIIFLDLNMPRKNGFECLEEIKRTPAYENIPVAIFTTTGETEAIEKTYKNKASLYIIKPPEFDSLSILIQKAIKLLKENSFNKLPKDKYVINHVEV